jgi:hypothetical protein
MRAAKEREALKRGKSHSSNHEQAIFERDNFITWRFYGSSRILCLFSASLHYAALLWHN